MFLKTEKSDVSLHYVSAVIDKEGSGDNLIQYSYIDLKQDLLCWLQENGRLPSTTTKEYFEEIKMLNSFEEEIKTLKEENESLKNENKSKKIQTGEHDNNANESYDQASKIGDENKSQDQPSQVNELEELKKLLAQKTNEIEELKSEVKGLHEQA